MTIAPGSTLQHYRLVQKIGEGGMGVVWRAEDTTLGRQVAIKILPAEFAQDAERLARFRQEARLLASLNHANIAAIHGLEQADGHHFLVLELVPGQDLAERLTSGPLPVEEALSICRQIAGALEAAHESGIVHRDLKPANVKLTPDEKIKVLDFGLAKAFTPDGGGDMSLSPTMTSPATQAGVLLGTVAYMSPEQARGKPLDRRTDIWSFGCVLYELLTARQAFPGETTTDCLVRILEREPEWSALPGDIPPKVKDLLRRCLRKDPLSRLRDIGDARIAIDEALSGTDPISTEGSASPAGRRSPSLPMLLVLLALASVLAGTLLGWALKGRGGTDPVGGLSVTEVARLTHDPGLSESPTWSPDGSLLAFASSRSGDFEIYVRRVDGGQEVNVSNHAGQDYQPAFSPDGDRIAFISTRSSRTGMIKIGSEFGMEFRTVGGDLWLAPALGGRARRLAEDANFPAWHPGGDRVAYISGVESHRSILEIPVDGGAAKTLLPGDSSEWEILRVQYAPGGRWLSFESVAGQIFLLPVTGGEPRLLLDGANHSHVWDAAGNRLLYFTYEALGGTRLLAVEVDIDRGTVRGHPRPFGLMTGLLRDLALSPDGRRLAVSEFEGSLSLTRLPLTPDGSRPAGPEMLLSRGQVIDRYPRVSPDGRRVAFASDRLGPMEVWITDVETGDQERLQLPGTDVGANLPFWTADGRTLAVTRFHGGNAQSIWLAAVDGSHAEELVPALPGLQGAEFSRDDGSILYSALSDGTSQMFVVDLESRQSRQITDSPGDKYPQEWSPDGRWILFVSNTSGAMQAWRMPAGGGVAERLTTGEERIRHAQYSSDGRWLYFQPSHRNIYRMPAGGGPAEPVTDFPDAGLFMEEPALSPDGRYITYCRSNGGSSLWRLTLGYE
ncbi:MAG: protein kinase [Gemmatimonadota bacterium]